MIGYVVLYIMGGKYRTIYADPPWPEYGGGKIKRGADQHYELMSVKSIIAMRFHIIDLSASDCHLYLWITNNHLPDGLQVMGEWGFRYITTITWVKDRFGLGQYFRGQTEHCLFGVKGAVEYRTDSTGKRAQGVTVIQAPRLEHSVKPEGVRIMIEKVSHPPRIELFARSHTPGWDAWGYEIDCDVDIF